MFSAIISSSLKLIIFSIFLINFHFLFAQAHDTTSLSSTSTARGDSHSHSLKSYDKNILAHNVTTREQHFTTSQKQNLTIPKKNSPRQQNPPTTIKPLVIYQSKDEVRNSKEKEIPKRNDSSTSSSRSSGGQLIGKRNFNHPQPEDVVGDQYKDTRVPIWNIAHMINSIEQIMPALQAGSNGIEVDISFDKRGFPIESYHGFPCDCGRHCHHREDFVKFVQYISKITYPSGSSNLQLILFDLKLKDLNEEQKERAGFYLASILYENLYKKYSAMIHQSPGANNYYGRDNNKDDESLFLNPPIRVIISINHITDVILIKSFLNHLIKNRLNFMGNQVGFDVGMNDNLTDISAMWDQLNGLTLNVWQGDGLTNCANIVRGVERLKEAISIRNGQGHFRKIYYWTADVMYQIRSVLRLGVDAILTNQPQRVNQVLEENEFKPKYRLATPFDYPFAQFWIKPTAWKMSPPTLEEAIETVSNIRETSANFVKTIPDGLTAIVKKVHSSIIALK